MNEKRKYLDILIKKENEAEYNHREASKTEKQLRAIHMAATRERISFENGMKN